MSSIARLACDRGPVDGGFWPAVARQLGAAWSAAGIEAQDAILLLPHGALLAPARAAFAAQGGWQPRVETPATLAASLAPPPEPTPNAPSGQRMPDRLAAAALLREQPFGRDWARRDPRAFDAAVAEIVATAHELLAAARARAPAERAAWWTAARAALPGGAGVGAGERLLARVALEWAALAEHDPFAPLWHLRPAAWAALRVGGAEPLLDALLDHAAALGVACWRLDAATSFDAAAAWPAPAVIVAGSLEDEAEQASAAVLAALDGGHAPVALVAEDRLLVRRIRALLERSGVALADETGWTLSTTRAAARLMAWLRAAAPGATRDAWLDAIKAEPGAEAARALEDAWRREREATAAQLAPLHALRERLARFRGPSERRLADWLAVLQACAAGLLDALAQDSAGRGVLAALRLDADGDDVAWSRLGQSTRLDLQGFLAWVADALEGESFVPAAPSAAEVIVTPLARATLRPFGATVFPGCDERRAAAPPPGLLPDAARRALGLRDAATRRRVALQAFAQVLRAPNLTLLRRSHEGIEPLAPSPALELALHARRRARAPLAVQQRLALPLQRVATRPIARPAPSMADALPLRLSASAAEALRECPYRFFARSGLRLAEAVELDAEPGKREHGRWLHAVLHAFHEGRDARARADDLDRLRRCAAAAAAHDDAASMLPFRAGFDAFARHYLAWLHKREADGWRYAAGEVARSIAPPDWGGVRLEGILDRIDVGPDGAAMVLDYKTGAADALRRRVKEPLEDTQLAFYAALLTEEPHEPPPRAIYLVLDERRAPQPIEHPDPAASAAALIDGLAGDLDALRRGEGAAALGEGEVCEHCEMRGLCRKDHWSVA
ncbi:MAG TPA: PD-(D/E)XK nuclease family protein [Burkholderiaceae bacterium]|nr:PD-(D/E)XK nuclease family protein [Burkholderiaceae bacterium]